MVETYAAVVKTRSYKRVFNYNELKKLIDAADGEWVLLDFDGRLKDAMALIYSAKKWDRTVYEFHRIGETIIMRLR